MRLVMLLLACSFSLIASAGEPQTYAKPELLVDVEALVAHLDEDQPLSDKPHLVLIDTRAIEDYKQGSIDSAAHVNVGEWKASFGDGTDAEAWSQRIGLVVPFANSTVVVYDNALTGDAARIWWILKYWGAGDVRILNGGFSAWKAAGGRAFSPLRVHLLPGDRNPLQNFDAKAHPERLATIDQVRALAANSDQPTCLVDARTDRENAAGNIPTAEHLDWQDLVDPETGKMRPADQLQTLLYRVGFQTDQPAVTYCQSGGRASVMAFAMELMGGEQVANYYGSWGEWSKGECRNPNNE